MDRAVLLLVFHAGELCSGATWLQSEGLPGEAKFSSLAHEHRATSANAATQLLAGLFGSMPLGKVASYSKGMNVMYFLVLSSYSCGITLATNHKSCCTHSHKPT